MELGIIERIADPGIGIEAVRPYITTVPAGLLAALITDPDQPNSNIITEW